MRKKRKTGLKNVINATKKNNAPASFNTSLPVPITVLEARPMNRYKLLIGQKEMVTKSQKVLDVGGRYWGEFKETKGGITALAGLCKKPFYLQKDDMYLSLECDEFLTQLSTKANIFDTYKDWILGNLSYLDTTKEGFLIFTQMLLALKEDIYIAPLLQDGKPMLMQFRPISEAATEFYLGIEHLGPIQGIISDNEPLELRFFYEKSARAVFKEMIKTQKNDLPQVYIDKTITPLYESSTMSLDLSI